MIADWKMEIASAWRIRQETAKLDKLNLWEYHSPRVGATVQEMAAAEAHLGHPLDPRYRDFLSCANGWECFYQRVNLFGTAELLGGGLMGAAREMLGEILPEATGKAGLAEPELLPIAASLTDIDMFVMTHASGAGKCGSVLWLAGYDIEQYGSFDDVFCAIVELNRGEYESFRDGKWLSYGGESSHG